MVSHNGIGTDESEQGCPTLRMLVAPCNSGSRAFVQTVSQNPDVYCLYQPIKAGIRADNMPDYSVLDIGKDPNHPVVQAHPAKVYVMKESIGPNNLEECSYNLFPSDEVIHRTMPVFLFRDPISTWNSWKKREWGTLDLFITAYKHTFDSFLYALDVAPYATRCITQEMLLEKPERLFTRICRDWDFEFQQDYLNWQHELENNPQINFRPTQKIYMEQIGTFKEFSGRKAFGINPEQNFDKTTLTAEEEVLIETHLRQIYQQVTKMTQIYYPEPVEKTITFAETGHQAAQGKMSLVQRANSRRRSGTGI